MALFDWNRAPPPDDRLDPGAGPEVLLRSLDRAVAQYLEMTDRGDLIYPACTRTPDAADGGPCEIWRHTRLEALRYLALIPGRESALLTVPARQAEMVEAYLRLKPHDQTVMDVTGRPADDVATAIIAGLNWLNHCAVLAKVDHTRITGLLRNFRKVVIVAQRWWGTEGAETRCREMLAAGQSPPFVLNLVFFEYTRLAKEVASAASFPGQEARANPAWPGFDAARDPDEMQQ